MKIIDVDELFNRKVTTSEFESSFNDDDIIDASVVREGKTKALVAVKGS